MFAIFSFTETQTRGGKKQNMCKIKFQVSQSIIRYRAFNLLEASNNLLCEGFEIYSFSSEIIKTDSISWRCTDKLNLALAVYHLHSGEMIQAGSTEFRGH